MIFNNYLLKAKWILLNNPQDKVKGIIWHYSSSYSWKIVEVLSNYVVNIRFDDEHFFQLIWLLLSKINTLLYIDCMLLTNQSFDSRSNLWEH